MRIVMISDLETTGGAAIAASRLAGGLLALGHPVERIVAIPNSNGNPWRTQTIMQKRTLPLRVVRRAVPRLGQLMDRTAAERALERVLGEARPDAINVHNLHYAQFAGWSEQMLRICARHAPTVWTLHDMWSFTGRCIAAYDCEKFVAGCDAACPTPGEYPALPPERIAGAWQARRALLAELPDVICVTPSRWMAGQARRGLWKDHRVEVIANGLPLHTYLPIDRAEARAALGLQVSGPVALVTAQVITDRRNGVDLLLAALRQATARPATLLVMGQGSLPDTIAGLRIVSIGVQSKESDRALAYNAADFTIYAAPVGNLPNVITESLACGTPVVAMPVCGVPEVVRPGVTGWLAGEASASGLAHAIEDAVHDWRASAHLREGCRRVAEAEFSQERQAQRYAGLFESLRGIGHVQQAEVQSAAALQRV